jgi:isopenicillin-N epimerase
MARAEAATNTALDLDLIRQEFPPAPNGEIYLNSGSCGRKPQSALNAIQRGWQLHNVNPTRMTFIDMEPREEARRAAARLLDVEPSSLLITNNTSDGLQLIMQSFLLNPGDEIVTSDHEHAVTKAICRFLRETRGIVVREFHTEPFQGSEALCKGMLELVNHKTKLVEVSEIGCLTGWRPNLDLLLESLNKANIPLLVDGAHAPGQGPCRPARYPLWVGSGHKWLGAPNGTGFAYVAPHLIPKLKPVWMDGHYYDFPDTDLTRFEARGTTDVVRLMGLTAACELHLRLDPKKIESRQFELVRYLRKRLKEIPGWTMRTPDVPGENSAMLTVTWPPGMVTVPDLRTALWDEFKIWIQPDFFFGDPGKGIRIACHMYNNENEVDKLIAALKTKIAVS